MSNIVLIGMPGCGKSTAGVLLAKALGMDFIDTDLIICASQKDKLQNIIESRGLEYFSKVESDVGKNLRSNNCVIATGGSMVLYPDAMENLKSLGKIVFIDVSYPELKRRVKNIKTRGITFREGESLRDLYEYRRTFYQKYADITLNVSSGTIEKTVRKIIDKLDLQ